MTVDGLIVQKSRIYICLRYEKLNRAKFINFVIHLISPSLFKKKNTLPLPLLTHTSAVLSRNNLTKKADEYKGWISDYSSLDDYRLTAVIEKHLLEWLGRRAGSVPSDEITLRG